MLLASTVRPSRKIQLPRLDGVCAAHADQFRPGTRYTSHRDGSIKLGGFRPDTTVDTVNPIG